MILKKGLEVISELEHFSRSILPQGCNSLFINLQVVQRLWERKDVRGLISAMEKMSDHAVGVLWSFFYCIN